MRRALSALIIAFSTYSRIPMPRADWSDENRRYSLCFFPLVGAAVGVALSAWLLLCDALATGALLRGAVGAALPLLVTGGIHMDGFMDTLDAMASWQPRERRLQILKDTHTGAFAVMGCCAYLLVMAGLLGEARAADGLALGACCVLSRALSALMLVHVRSARPDGMLASFARVSHRRAVTAACACFLALSAAALLARAGALGLAALGAALACTAAYGRFALRQFGGLTGDLAGWFVQVTELVCAFVIVWGGRLP